jgi:hypothetical protein
MNHEPFQLDPLQLTRRQLLGRSAVGLGTAALSSLLGPEIFAAPGASPLHHAAKAKRVIYLFQEGAPSQLELFDYKPQLEKLRGQELPDSVRMGQRITGMTSIQKSLPLVPSAFTFKQYGQSGAWLSSLLPHTAKMADELCIVRSMYTEAINHDPALTFIQTGSQTPGRPSFGSWLSYGLGSMNADLPAFVVLVSIGTAGSGQPLTPRFWGSGFLPSEHQGIRLRSTGDAVLYLGNPAGVSAKAQRETIATIGELNRLEHETSGDPEILARIKNHELAYRMQTSVPDLLDTSSEPESVYELYGAAAKQRGTFASNCLMARRLAERGVRFIQLYHTKWDHHANLPNDLPKQCADIDQPCAALLTDLKQRGMLDDTLVIWGGEFGRTVYCQGDLTSNNYGRDHHPRCFTMWLAGGGIKPGITHGETDDFSYNILDQKSKGVHVHDLQATVLHLLGIDHTKLTYRSQGRDFRLTDVHGRVVQAVLA